MGWRAFATPESVPLPTEVALRNIQEREKFSHAARHEIVLEDVVFILGPKFLLSVDQEKSDDVVDVPLANLLLNVDIGELRIGGLGLDRPDLQRNVDDVAPHIPLPNQQRVALVIGLTFSVFSFVLGPSCAHLN